MNRECKCGGILGSWACKEEDKKYIKDYFNV
jgi:hypothetical protein